MLKEKWISETLQQERKVVLRGDGATWGAFEVLRVEPVHQEVDSDLQAAGGGMQEARETEDPAADCSWPAPQWP